MVQIRHWLTCDSGVMPQSIRLLLEPFLRPEISITSGISATDIPPFSIVLPMLQLDRCPISLSSRRRPRTRRHVKKRTTTGQWLIHPRRTGSAVVANATRRFLKWRARRAAVFPNGSRLLEDGPRLDMRRRYFHLLYHGNSFHAPFEKIGVIGLLHTGWLGISRGVSVALRQHRVDGLATTSNVI